MNLHLLLHAALLLQLVAFLSFQLVQVTSDATPCIEKALQVLDISKVHDSLSNLVIHRNGEPEPCAITRLTRQGFEQATKAVVKHCAKSVDNINKYQMESVLTAYLRDQLDTTNSCGSIDNATAPEGMAGYCDMGPLRTTIQPDTALLVQQPDGSLPCRYYTREGRRISSMNDLVELSKLAINNYYYDDPDQEGKDSSSSCGGQDQQTCSSQSGPSLHLYAVPAGRVFMFAPSFVGEKFILDHVQGASSSASSSSPSPSSSDTSSKLVLEVISLSPRLFEIYDFFSKEEATALIEKTLAETDEEFGLHRSRTGATSKSIFNKRTSENAWDTNGQVAMDIKQRCMEMLGFDEYWSSHTDGLQILRYKNAQAYVAHHDYLQIKAESKTDPYNYNTSEVGGNRFATILLYMTDLSDTDGGETLFESAMRPGLTSMPPKDQAVQLLRESGDPKLAILEADSWEETMTAMCRSRLSIQPRTGRAVLFYSQFPNGQQDKSVLHGGCPVLNGTKWAANLWVWNAPRTGNRLAPQKNNQQSSSTNANANANAGSSSDLYVTFRNDKKDPRYKDAEIYYKDTTNFGSLGHGESFRAKTYKGHVWNIKVDGETVFTHTITGKEEEEIVVV